MYYIIRLLFFILLLYPDFLIAEETCTETCTQTPIKVCPDPDDEKQCYTSWEEVCTIRCTGTSTFRGLFEQPYQFSSSNYISIGTGGITGNFYPIGGGIASLINMNKQSHGIRATVEPSLGSFANLNAIASGEFDLAIVQSDLHYHAYKGTDQFKESGPNNHLRSLFSLYNYPFTIVARSGSGIQHVNDLRGKRISLGSKKSNTYESIEYISQKLGWNLSEIENIPKGKILDLCDNKIDALVMYVNHPSSSIKEASILCDINLVNLGDSLVNDIISGKYYYTKNIVPAGFYKGSDKNILTFGSMATMVTSSKVSTDVVYNVVKSVFDNWNSFKKMHPSLKYLRLEEMVKNGLTAPLHPGALKYYKEVGLM